MKKIPKFIALSIVLIMMASCSSETVSSTEDTASRATLSRYRENEIQDYKGARLDPAIGPRDNSIKGVQFVDMQDYELKLTGLVNQSINLNYDDVLALEAYQRKITLYCVEGWDATILWEGALLKDIINHYWMC